MAALYNVDCAANPANLPCAQTSEKLDLAESKIMSLQKLVDLRTSELTALEGVCSAKRAVFNSPT